MDEGATGRSVYLPPGAWIDYQTGKTYRGAQWHRIEAGPVPVVLLARDHTVIPHVRLPQSTDQIDWTEVELRVFSTDDAAAAGLFTLPQGPLQTLRLDAGQGGYALRDDPARGRVRWRVSRFGARQETGSGLSLPAGVRCTRRRCFRGPGAGRDKPGPSGDVGREAFNRVPLRAG
jgi:alpha-D-xyloside xylohydrolase